MALDIERIFSHHPPRGEEVRRAHAQVRVECRSAATIFDELLPESAEKTLAIRHLQMAMMFANSAIAQYGVNDG